MNFLDWKRRGLFAAIVLASISAPSAMAAGSVAMQVEHLVKNAMAEYNTAMEDNDSPAFLKYFAANARYESPVFRYVGKAEIGRHLAAEFQAYKARYEVNRMFVRDNAAALVLVWEAVDRKSGDQVRIEMVGVFEVGDSGQFSSAVFYLDSAKAKALANLGR